MNLPINTGFAGGADFNGSNFNTLFGGGSEGSGGGFDFSSLTTSLGNWLGGASGGSQAQNPANPNAGGVGSSIGGIAGGVIGSAILPGVGTALGTFFGNTIGGLVGGPATNAQQQSADINRIAATNRVTPAHAAAVIANHANRSSDNFDDLAAYTANNNSRFYSLLDEYNSANPNARISIGETANGLPTAYASTGQSQVADALAGNANTIPPLATAPFVPVNGALPTNAAGKSNVQTYVLLGSGSVVLLLILFLLLKK